MTTATPSSPDRIFPAVVKPLSHAARAATRKVIDAPTRIFHWGFTLCFLGAYITSESEKLRLVHVTLGYTMAGLFAFRIIWGLVGPRHVRLGLLWRKLTGAPDWFKSLKRARSPSAINWRQGQNLLMSAAVVALLFAVIPVTLTGYASLNDWGGKWLKQIHEGAGEFYLWLVIGHLALIALLSVLRRKNQAMPMLTGKMEGVGPDLIRKDHRIIAGCLVATIAGWWLSQMLA